MPIGVASWPMNTPEAGDEIWWGPECRNIMSVSGVVWEPEHGDVWIGEDLRHGGGVRWKRFAARVLVRVGWCIGVKGRTGVWYIRQLDPGDVIVREERDARWDRLTH